MTIAEEILKNIPVRDESLSDPTTDYALDVVEGNIVAGPPVRMACQRHLDDLENGHKRNLYFDVAAANKVITWFPQNLRHYMGEFEGAPFELHVSQAFIVGSIFGWKRIKTKDDGSRQHVRKFQTAFILEGKGAGKTPLAAGIGLYCLTDDGEANPLVPAAAVTAAQARDLYMCAKLFAENSPTLSGRLVIGDYKMRCPENNGEFRIMSGDSKAIDGPTPSASLVDEIHEHRSADVINKLNAGKKVRVNPLIFEITNTGFDKNTVCGEHYDLSIMILKGVVLNDKWFAYVCALEDEDDWMNEDQWPMANPLLGTSIDMDYLRGQIEEAMQMPTKLALAKRLNLCIWTESDKQWIPEKSWAQLAIPRHERDLIGKGFCHSIDMSGNSDFSAINHWFGPDENHDRPYLKTHLFLPEGTIQTLQDPEIIASIMQWAQDGWITLMPGNMIDREAFREIALQEIIRYGGNIIAYDRWQMDETAQYLASQNDDFEVVAVNQTHSNMNRPCLTFERMVMREELEHDGNPAMKWMIANASLDMNMAGYVKLNKGRKGKKIDGVSAAVMSAGVYSKPPVVESNESVYAKRGMIKT